MFGFSFCSSLNCVGGATSLLARASVCLLLARQLYLLVPRRDCDAHRGSALFCVVCLQLVYRSTEKRAWLKTVTEFGPTSIVFTPTAQVSSSVSALFVVLRGILAALAAALLCAASCRATEPFGACVTMVCLGWFCLQDVHKFTNEMLEGMVSTVDAVERIMENQKFKPYFPNQVRSYSRSCVGLLPLPSRHSLSLP